MYRSLCSVVLILLVSFLLNSASVRAEEQGQSNSTQVEAAIAAAKSWLSIVDSGQYSRSWDEASSYFKGVMAKQKWEEMLRGYRAPFGKLLSRNVKNAVYTKTLPGAPDGEYVVIMFETSFEKKSQAVETVTPNRDADGKWRVGGYFIR